MDLLVLLEQPYREDLSEQRLCHAYAITLKHIMYTKVAVHIPCTTFFFRMTLADIEDLYPPLWKTTTKTATQSLAEVPVTERYRDERSDFSLQAHLSDGAC